jgi:hypothetical protein
LIGLNTFPRGATAFFKQLCATAFLCNFEQLPFLSNCVFEATSSDFEQLDFSSHSVQLRFNCNFEQLRFLNNCVLSNFEQLRFLSNLKLKVA